MNRIIPFELSAEEFKSRIRLREFLVLGTFALACLGLAILSSRPAYIPYAGGALLGSTVLGVAFLRPRLGLYLFLAASLVIEQFNVPVIEPLTARIPFFQNINNFTPLSFFSATPAELFLITLILGHIVLSLHNREPIFIRPNPLTVPTLLLLAALAYGFLLGIGTGGLVNIALWEVRSLVYLCVMVFLVPNLIRNRKDLETAVWVIAGAVSFKALQGTLSIIYPLQGHLSWVESIVGHEDALFFDTIIVLAISMTIFGCRHRQRRFLWLAMPFLLISLIAAQRRAAFMSFGLAYAVIITILYFEKPRLATKILFPTLFLITIYMGVFWNSDQLIARPAQAVKSVIQPEGRDALSNLYRIAENINIRHNIEKRPFTGLGFGNKYEIIAPMAKIGYSLWEYITHNAILWFWMKTGMMGFIAFWVFFGSVVVTGATYIRTLKDGYLKSVALFVVTFTVMQLVTSYVDLQLTFYRNMIYLGAAIGLLICLTTLREVAD